MIYYKIIHYTSYYDKSGKYRVKVFRTDFVKGSLKQARAKAISLDRIKRGYSDIVRADTDTRVGTVGWNPANPWDRGYYTWTTSKEHRYVLNGDGSLGKLKW